MCPHHYHYIHYVLYTVSLPMEFKEISRDVINRRLRDKSGIYKDLPASHNKGNVNAKAIYLIKENKYAPFLSYGFCAKTFM